jgi:hypothetical protein
MFMLVVKLDDLMLCGYCELELRLNVFLLQ